MRVYIGYISIVCITITIILSYAIFSYIPSRFDKWTLRCSTYKNKLDNRLISLSRLCSAIRRKSIPFQDFKSKHYHDLYEPTMEQWLIAQKGQHHISSQLDLCRLPVNIPSNISRYVYIRFIGDAMISLISSCWRLRLADRILTKQLEPSINLSRKKYNSLKTVPSQVEEENNLILDKRIADIESIVANSTNSDPLFYEDNQELLELQKVFNSTQYYLNGMPSKDSIDQIAQEFERAEQCLLKLEETVFYKYKHDNSTNSEIKQAKKELSTTVNYIKQQGQIEEFNPIIQQVTRSLSSATNLRLSGKFKKARTKANFSQKMINLSFILAETESNVRYLSQVKKVSLLNTKIGSVTSEYQRVFNQASIRITNENIDELHKTTRNVQKTTRKLREKHQKDISRLEKNVKNELTKIEKEWQTIKKDTPITKDPLIDEFNILSSRYMGLQGKPVLLLQYHNNLKTYSSKLKTFHKHLNALISRINFTQKKFLAIKIAAKTYAYDWACLTQSTNRILQIEQDNKSVISKLPMQNIYTQVRDSAREIDSLFTSAEQLFSNVRQNHKELSSKRKHIDDLTKVLKTDFPNDSSINQRIKKIGDGIRIAQKENNYTEANRRLGDMSSYTLSILSDKNQGGKYNIFISGGNNTGIVQGDNASLSQNIRINNY